MKSLVTLLSLFAFSFIFFSCQKELSLEPSAPGGNDNTSLTGNWKFDSLIASMEAATALTENGVPAKIVAKYKDTTENNAGTVTITSGSINASGLSYDFSAVATVDTYLAGIPVDSESAPFELAVPTYSANSNYKQIGTDSLYFPQGLFFVVPDPTGIIPQSSSPAGAKYKITGNSLAIMFSLTQDTTITQSGITATITTKVNGVANFEKK